jgi:hypothetical protein
MDAPGSKPEVKGQKEARGARLPLASAKKRTDEATGLRRRLHRSPTLN